MSDNDPCLYTYTIFDGDPTAGGPCAWPSHESVEIEADSAEEALASALEEALASAATYGAGDRLYAIVWDHVDQVVAEGSAVVEDA